MPIPPLPIIQSSWDFGKYLGEVLRGGRRRNTGKNGTFFAGNIAVDAHSADPQCRRVFCGFGWFLDVDGGKGVPGVRFWTPIGKGRAGRGLFRVLLIFVDVVQYIPSHFWVELEVGWVVGHNRRYSPKREEGKQCSIAGNTVVNAF